MTVNEIHSALKSGKKVCWKNGIYEVRRSPKRSGSLGQYDVNHDTFLDGAVLEIRCIDNGFGGYADLSELKDCYILNI